ncbi:MAG: hypothetical protein HZC16_02120 [Candidatus Omnitrophica bacterium]|nr:hypothetical protein [Candidatus Omnitrophota bacterium]
MAVRGTEGAEQAQLPRETAAEKAGELLEAVTRETTVISSRARQSSVAGRFRDYVPAA